MVCCEGSVLWHHASMAIACLSLFFNPFSSVRPTGQVRAICQDLLDRVLNALLLGVGSARHPG